MKLSILATLCNLLSAMMVIADLNVHVNKLISKFGHLQPDVQINLFNTYCCSFYGSSLWHLHSSGFKSCLTAWNIGARKVLNIPYSSYLDAWSTYEFDSC